uniref:Enoyl-CoA hydratase n=1 Tax=OCS116 cluster bacterium TaxID=2030921 RepID=A0A2A4Z027_9PROT
MNKIYDFCVVQKDGHLTIITMNRPEVMNALHYEADLELNDVFDDFRDDPSQWVAIITGAGDRAFSAGNDLKAQAKVKGQRQLPKGGFAGFSMRTDINKPVIAAVNGFAMGGGFEVALACDIVIAAENATFALPEPRVGLAALAGGTVRLPMLIGWQRAMGILLTGRRVEAREGAELGFVTAVAKPGQALAVAREWASQIMECSPVAVQASKSVAHAAFYGDGFEELLHRNFSVIREMRTSKDYLKGPAAFAEKRNPNWTNS